MKTHSFTRCMLLPVLLLLAISSCIDSKLQPSGQGDQNALSTHVQSGRPGSEPPVISWETVMDGNSFGSYTTLEGAWNYLYPWGSDHNGSARMYASSTDHSQVLVETPGVLTIKATKVPETEGKSSSDPHLLIRYHSGAIYAKQKLTINDQYDAWDLSGEFMSPVARGTWPAFWITGASRWPPESDILEFKGNNVCWQNTADGPDWRNIGWETAKTTVADADVAWHSYRVFMTRVKDERGRWTSDVKCEYYIDGELKGTHTGTNFYNQTFDIIINLQMEGSSDSPGPLGETFYYAKNIVVKRGKMH